MWFSKAFRRRGKGAFNEYFQRDGDRVRSVRAKKIFNEKGVVIYTVKDGNYICDNTSVEERTSASKTPLLCALYDMVAEGLSMAEIALSSEMRRGWRYLRMLKEYHTAYHNAQAVCGPTLPWTPLVVVDGWAQIVAEWLNRNMADGYVMPLRTDILASAVAKKHLWIWVCLASVVSMLPGPDGLWEVNVDSVVVQSTPSLYSGDDRLVGAVQRGSFPSGSPRGVPWSTDAPVDEAMAW